MKPDVASVLAAHADRLLTRIAPQLTGFDANSASMMGLMLQMVAEHWNVAAARLVEENHAIRVLFAAATETIDDVAMASRLETLAGGSDDDLRLDALEAGNDALRAALVDLHALVEQRSDDIALAIDGAIWDELRRSTERRRISSANF